MMFCSTDVMPSFWLKMFSRRQRWAPGKANYHKLPLFASPVQGGIVVHDAGHFFISPNRVKRQMDTPTL